MCLFLLKVEIRIKQQQKKKNQKSQNKKSYLLAHCLPYYYNFFFFLFYRNHCELLSFSAENNRLKIPKYGLKFKLFSVDSITFKQ